MTTQHATQQIRSYFKIDYANFKDQFNIDFKDYFNEEIKYLDEMVKDGLVIIKEDGIFNRNWPDFTQNIMNILINMILQTKLTKRDLKQ